MTSQDERPPVPEAPVDSIALDIFKQYHLYHTDPKFLLGQKVCLTDNPEETGRVIGYFTSVQIPAGHVIDTAGGIVYAAPAQMQAVGA